MAKKKVMINGEVATLHDERETRANVLNIGRELGIEFEVRRVFDKWDAILKQAKESRSPEYAALQIAANEELHFLLTDHPGYISVNGKKIGRE